MAIILTSGMLVAAVEVSMIVASTIRQARTLDRTLVAFYAAESGSENALHQIRKEGLTTLRPDSLTSQEGLYHVDGRDGRWSFGAPDSDTFSSTVRTIPKAYLPEQQSIDIHLWQETTSGFQAQDAALRTMVVRWRSADCGSGDIPWIETTALALNVAGGSIVWQGSAPSSPITKKFQHPTDALPNQITVDLESLLPLGSNGLSLRIKPFFCSLRNVEVFFPENGNDAAPLPIPQYYLIRPRGTFGGVEKSLSVIMPARPGTTGIFDYVLFSDKEINKSED